MGSCTAATTARAERQLVKIVKLAHRAAQGVFKERRAAVNVDRPCAGAVVAQGDAAEQHTPGDGGPYCVEVEEGRCAGLVGDGGNDDGDRHAVADGSARPGLGIASDDGGDAADFRAANRHTFPRKEVY